MFNDKRRGDIWWAQDTAHKREDTCLIRGDRPVVIVSSDEVNCNTRIITVVPLTSSPAQLARGDGTYDQVLLTGYGAPSMALTRQVHAVDTDDLTEYRGHLTDADMLRLDAVLRRALGYEVVHGLPPPNRGDSRLRHRAAGGRGFRDEDGQLLHGRLPEPGMEKPQI